MNGLTNEQLSAIADRKKRKLDKKRLKIEMGATQKGDSQWPNCLFWLAKSNRFCSGKRAPNSQYCMNHIHADIMSEKSGEKYSRKRVICPIDPSHTVYEYKLKKHIIICNKTKKEEDNANCPYFVPDLNVGDDRNCRKFIEESKQQKEAFEHQLETKIRDVFSYLFPNDIPTEVIRPDSFEPFLQDKVVRGATKDSLRHLYQQASIISHMQKLNLLNDEYVYVEFGAGRGMLCLGIDYCLNDHLPNESVERDSTSKGKYLLIDMSPVRFKADRWLRHKESNFLRVTGNIRDIALRKVPIFSSVDNRGFVGIAKHLCGVATDYTIRCILNCISKNSTDFELKCGGICIATCCHHRCQWHSFVGREIYSKLGFIEEEWDYIRKMTGWATTLSKEHSSNEDVEKTIDGFSAQKSVNKDTLTYNSAKVEYTKMDPVLGRMCKRIIDYCRSKFIEEQVNSILEKNNSSERFKVEMVYYCEAEDSPENCVILGYLV